MKQTAVQWYAIESGKLEVERAKGYLTFSQMFDKMLEILKQAKAMEKEQIRDAYMEGYLEEIPNPSESHYYKDMAEDYYNETFKSE